MFFSQAGMDEMHPPTCAVHHPSHAASIYRPQCGLLLGYASQRWSLGCGRKFAARTGFDALASQPFPTPAPLPIGSSNPLAPNDQKGVRRTPFFGRRERIRTSDPTHPKGVRYQAAPRAVNLLLYGLQLNGSRKHSKAVGSGQELRQLAEPMMQFPQGRCDGLEPFLR